MIWFWLFWAVLFFCIGFLTCEGITTWTRHHPKYKETNFVALNRRRK